MLARSDKQTFPWHQGHLVKFWHGHWQQVTSFPRNSPKCNTQADKINSYSKQKSFCPTLVTLSVTASWSFQFGPIRCGQVQETVFFVLGFQRETRKAFLQILLSFPVTELKTEAQKKCFEVRTQIHLESLALSLKLVNEIGNHRCRRMKTKNVPENTRFGKKNMYGMAKHLSAQREKKHTDTNGRVRSADAPSVSWGSTWAAAAERRWRATGTCAAWSRATCGPPPTIRARSAPSASESALRPPQPKKMTTGSIQSVTRGQRTAHQLQQPAGFNGHPKKVGYRSIL